MKNLQEFVMAQLVKLGYKTEHYSPQSIKLQSRSNNFILMYYYIKDNTAIQFNLEMESKERLNCSEFFYIVTDENLKYFNENLPIWLNKAMYDMENYTQTPINKE